MAEEINIRRIVEESYTAAEGDPNEALRIAFDTYEREAGLPERTLSRPKGVSGEMYISDALLSVGRPDRDPQEHRKAMVIRHITQLLEKRIAYRTAFRP